MVRKKPGVLGIASGIPAVDGSYREPEELNVGDYSRSGNMPDSKTGGGTRGSGFRYDG